MHCYCDGNCTCCRLARMEAEIAELKNGQKAILEAIKESAADRELIRKLNDHLAKSTADMVTAIPPAK